MVSLTITDIPEPIHRALSVRAARQGHSLEAEVRSILQQAVEPEGGTPVGTAHAELWGAVGLTKEEADLIESVRDRTPADPMSFDHIAITPDELSDNAVEAILTAKFSTDLDENG